LTRSKWHDRHYKASEENLKLSKNASVAAKVYWKVTTFCAVPFLAIRTWFDRTSKRRLGLRRTYNGYVKLFKDSQFVIGKWTSALVYVFSVFMAIACPMLFISSVVMNEIYVRFYPVSEQNDAVGQWGSWISALFVIIAAVIVRVNPAFWHIIGRGYANIVRFVRQTRGSQSPDSEEEVKRNETDTLQGAIIAFLSLCTEPFTHAYGSTINAKVRAVNEVKEFVERWQDPELHSTWDWVGKDIKWWDDMIELGEYFTSWDTDVETLTHLQGSSKPLKDILGRAEHAKTQDFNLSSHDVTVNEEAMTDSPGSTASSPRSLRSPREHTSIDLGRSSAWDGRQDIEMEDISLLRHDAPRGDGPPSRNHGSF
jgi:hypothetical protein